MTKLYESDHAYYQSEGCYFSNDCHGDFACWDDFIGAFGDVDLDYNRVIRWDWYTPDPADVKDSIASGEAPDSMWNVEHLRVYWMMQRKARPLSTYVKITKADEPAVRAFLQPHLEYTLKLWEPLTSAET